MRESARTALAWLRANAARYGLDPAFQRDTDVHLHVQSAEVPPRLRTRGRAGCPRRRCPRPACAAAPVPDRAPGRGRPGRSPREPRRPCFPSFADGASAPPAEARSPPPCTCRHTRLRRRAERPSGEQPTTTASASSATTGHGASGDDDIPTPAHETRRPSSARRSPTGAERRPPVQLRERSHPVAPVRGRRRRTVRSRIAAVRSLMDVSFRRARRAVSPAVRRPAGWES